MNCDRFAEILLQRLEGAVDASLQEQVQDHAAGCARCRELEALVLDVSSSAAIEPPPELLGTVLARTSGGSCERAQELLCARLDVVPAEGEADAPLRLHLDHCADCSALARALPLLRRELATLADMQPDAGFLDAVLEATLPTAPLGGRVREWWARALQRPRLALEGAYAGTLAVVLLMGLPGSPLGGFPAEVLAEVREERAQMEIHMTAGAERVAAVGRSAWSKTGDHLVAYVAGCEGEPAGLRGAWQCWQQIGRDTGATVWQRTVQLWQRTVQPVVDRLLARWHEAPWNAAEDSVQAVSNEPESNSV